MAHHPRVPHTAFDIVCPSKVLPMENSPHLRIALSTRNHMTFLTGCLQEFQCNYIQILNFISKTTALRFSFMGPVID